MNSKKSSKTVSNVGGNSKIVAVSAVGSGTGIVVLVRHEADEAVNVTYKVIKITSLGEVSGEELGVTKVGIKAAQDLEELPENYRIDKVLDTIDHSHKVISLVGELGQSQTVEVDCNRKIVTKGGSEIPISSFEWKNSFQEICRHPSDDIYSSGAMYVVLFILMLGVGFWAVKRLSGQSRKPHVI